jgi:hypothetical protein
VESLDDVIDAMIADRVIHRHRRSWLIVIALVVVLALVVFFTGGWKQKQGRRVDTLQAPVTVEAGRFEYGVTSARIIRTPKSRYDPAKARVEVSIALKNLDEEEHESDSMTGSLLRLVPGGGEDLIESNGATCRGELNYVVVYGLPAQSCTTKFDVPADFSTDMIELAVLGEKYESDNSLLGAADRPYWHNEEAVAVVRVPTTTTTETK